VELVCFDLQQKAFKRDQDTFVAKMRKRERESKRERERGRKKEGEKKRE
jgi:hypothetical protein